MTYVSEYYEKHPDAAKRLKAMGEKNKKRTSVKEEKEDVVE
jgi:hypothetical protein